MSHIWYVLRVFDSLILPSLSSESRDSRFMSRINESHTHDSWLTYETCLPWDDSCLVRDHEPHATWDIMCDVYVWYTTHHCDVCVIYDSSLTNRFVIVYHTYMRRDTTCVMCTCDMWLITCDAYVWYITHRYHETWLMNPIRRDSSIKDECCESRTHVSHEHIHTYVDTWFMCRHIKTTDECTDCLQSVDETWLMNHMNQVPDSKLSTYTIVCVGNLESNWRVHWL